MTPEDPIDPCAVRPITPGEYRFLSRIGRETGIDLSAYGLTDNLLVEPITPNTCGGITFDLDGEGYRMRCSYYHLVEGSFYDPDGLPAVNFSLSLDARGTLYELDVIINGNEPADYPLDSEPIIIDYPHGEVQAAAVQSIPWQNPTRPPAPIEMRKIRSDEYDFLCHLSRESGVDLFTLGLSEDLLVKPYSNQRKRDLIFMIDDQPYSGSSNRSVIDGTFRDSDGIPAVVTLTINKQEKLELIMLSRFDRRPLTRFPQPSDDIKIHYPRRLGNLS